MFLGQTFNMIAIGSQYSFGVKMFGLSKNLGGQIFWGVTFGGGSNFFRSISKWISEQISQQISQWIPQQISQWISQGISQWIGLPIFQRISQLITKQSSKHIS